MYSIIVENESGMWVQLTGNRNYDLLSVTGANPPSANINTSTVVGMDGTLFNSARVNQRNIVLTLAIHYPIESNRQVLYDLFKIKGIVKVKYKTDFRDVYISGYVESIEVNAWSQIQKAQISIICPQPFWMAEEDTIIRFTDSIAMFEFPFSIPAEGIEFSRLAQLTSVMMNAGEIEIGGIITFRAKSDGVQNPGFYNLTTQKYFGVDITMQSGDIITINTNYGKKSVTLLRSGEVTNLLPYRKSGSEWVQFVSGSNILSIDAAESLSNLDASVTVTQKFEGV